MSLADHADNRRRTTKTTIISPPSQTVFLCVIMQLAAFLCVICAICGRITRKSTLSIAKEETPMSLADLADLRRQKTVRSNVSAKADAADNAEKDSYHIVETKLFMFIQQICEGTRSFLPCYFLVFPSFIPYVFNGRSHGNVVQARAETSSLLECYAESSRHS